MMSNSPSPADGRSGTFPSLQRRGSTAECSGPVGTLAEHGHVTEALTAVVSLEIIVSGSTYTPDFYTKVSGFTLLWRSFRL